jgi:succinate-acetate transporter protein
MFILGALFLFTDHKAIMYLYGISGMFVAVISMYFGYAMIINDSIG